LNDVEGVVSHVVELVVELVVAVNVKVQRVGEEASKIVELERKNLN
jgi:hypothetical protein